MQLWQSQHRKIALVTPVLSTAAWWPSHWSTFTWPPTVVGFLVAAKTVTSLWGKTRGTLRTISTTRTTTVLIVTPTRLGGNRSNSSLTSSPQDPSAGPVTMRGPTGKTLTLTIDPQTRITTGKKFFHQCFGNFSLFYMQSKNSRVANAKDSWYYVA